MEYAIVQKELVVPKVEQLKRAFSVSPLLTGLDAQTVAHDAYGILLRGLDVEQAGTLREALLREGVETELVGESKLPVIPPAKVVRQVEFYSSHLRIYDPMRRAALLPWKEILLIAAGYVRRREPRPHRNALADPPFHGERRAPHGVSGGKLRETGSHMLLDLFVNGGATRFSITAEEFTFDHLGTRLTNDLALNFVSLIEDLSQEAPHAALNRGAYLACQKSPELFPYPSKAAFNEEITWMLWRIGQLDSTRTSEYP